MPYNVVCFCYTVTQISSNRTYIPSLLRLPPLLPTHPSRSSSSTGLDSRCHITVSHQLFVLHRIMYICWCYFLHSSYPLLLLMGPQVHSLHVSLCSFSASRFISTTFLDSIYVLIWYLCFLSSLCTLGSRFIHITTTDSTSFLFMTNIRLYICTTFLSIHLSVDI